MLNFYFLRYWAIYIFKYIFKLILISNKQILICKMKIFTSGCVILPVKALKKGSHKNETEYRNFKTLFGAIEKTSRKSYNQNLIEI